ncbi:MAG: hypothetical protein DI538_31120, partial [Azospira oryzae]
MTDVGWVAIRLGEVVAYELETIETKIEEHIFLASSESITIDAPQFLKELDDECVKIKRAFRNRITSFENDDLIKRYFHFHQESLIDLINSINIKLDGGYHGIYSDSIILKLAALLEYLEDHFPEYFDVDMKMPTASRGRVKEELQSLIRVLSIKFSSPGIDFGLVELLKRSIEESCFDNDCDVSFRQYYYFKFFNSAVANFDVSEGQETIDLIALLFHVNFNSEKFYKYVVRYIEWAVHKAQSAADKIDQLAFYLKFVNQEGGASKLAYDHQRLPINIQIAEWTAQEIQYLKTKQQMAPYSTTVDEAVSPDFKLNFDLSVSV